MKVLKTSREVVRFFVYSTFNTMKENRRRLGDFPKNSEVCPRMPKIPEKEPKMFPSYIIYIPESRVQSPESRVQSSPESSPGFRLCRLHGNLLIKGTINNFERLSVI